MHTSSHGFTAIVSVCLTTKASVLPVKLLKRYNTFVVFVVTHHAWWCAQVHVTVSVIRNICIFIVHRGQCHLIDALPSFIRAQLY